MASFVSRVPRSTLAAVVLMGATVIWGAGFVFMKSSVGHMPSSAFTFWRFLIASIVLFAVQPRKVFRGGRRIAVRGLFVGLLLTASYLLLLWGMRTVTVTTSAFISAMFVVVTPVLAWPLLRERVRRSGWAAVGIAIVGIALLTGVGRNVSFGRGEVLTLASAICVSLQILYVTRWTRRAFIWSLAFWQVVGVTVFSGIVMVASRQVVLPSTPSLWLNVAFMGLFASALGFMVQAWGQLHVPATTASIIYTLEPVFAAIGGIIVFGDPITLPIVAGGVLILSASWLSEVADRRGRDLATPHVEV